MKLDKVCKPFSLLTALELYTLLRLRNQVFVIEQNCLYQDMDNIDQSCHHLMLYNKEELVGYARLIPPGVCFPEISIGRVVTSREHRKIGAGRQLVAEAIEECYFLFGKRNILIGAQLYLKKFYESFGFMQHSEVYDEDGIEHIKMINRN